MNKLVDQYGQPIDKGVLKEPQTSRVASLQNEYLTSNLDGLTPARLAATLRNADSGDLFAQHRLFADMEERDAHLAAEMGKRKLALLGLDWSIQPPRNATAAEKAHAEWLTEVLTDAVDPIEDLILALMDGVGHGFAAVEQEWRSDGGELLPAFNPRPQEWFQLDQSRREIRLRDLSADGAPLAPFGWVFHTHGKAKTGYLGRLGLYRVLSWPFLYKAYAIGDFAELLETFGLPILVGKYFSGASKDEKASLMRAVTSLGHDARAIMPADMEIELKEVSYSGSKSIHLEMVDWAERSISKGILGQTMSAEAKSTGIGSGNADLHADVRQDILKADAREIAGTLTRDLLYPLIALNRGGIDGLRRCPRFVFDTGEAEDLKLFADALPKLAGAGLRIPVAWAHDKLRIAQPTGDEPVLSAPKPATVPTAEGGEPPKGPPAALSAQAAGPAPQDHAPLIAAQQTLDAALDAPLDWTKVTDPLLKPVLDALAGGRAPEEILAEMAAWYPLLDDAALVETLSRALFVADCWGRLSAQGD